MATSNNTDETDDEKTAETRGSYRLLQVMTAYGREFCFLLAVLFTAFAAFQNGPLKTRKANPPQRFFPLSSLVTDFYVGNMQGLNTLLMENDISIVMYYAPWDAVCIQARSEFETAARYYHAQVFFAAVNCWWPEGECRRSLKLQSYPLLLAHVRRAGTVTYSGPLLATYLIPFLDNVLSPVFPIYQQGELLDLQAQHEAVMVGYFEFHSSPQPPGYRQYYIAALKMLGKDTTRRLGFAVVTSRAAAVRLRVTAESVILHSWNGTKVYPEPIVKSENLVNWAYNNLHQVCTWLSPSGMKSRLMAQVLEKSPTLILFTPRNLMLGPPPYYDLLRETAMNYYNCDNSPGVTSVIHRIILKRHIKQKDFDKLRDVCSPRNVDMTATGEQPFASACCQSNTISMSRRKSSSKGDNNCYCSSCIYTANGWPLASGDDVCRKALQVASINRRLRKGSCDSRRFSLNLGGNPFYFASFKCLSRQSEFAKLTLSLAVGTSKASGVEDDKIIKMSLTKKKQECRHLNLALKYSSFNFPLAPPQPSLSYWQANFSGLGCRTNRSLSFLALDTVLHHTFAEHLGVDIYAMPHQTAAIIVEAKQESQYLLPDVNKHSLVDFIKNFTLGRLDRYLRSVSSPYPTSPLDELAGALCVLEVTTDTFAEIVLNQNKDVILMYYAPWCVFCSGIAHIYLTVAKFFSDVEGITFARINGDLNDLPWEFTVEKYPTILFFPAHRKSESVEFPSTLPINNVNLIQFVLANARPNIRWQAAMQLCDGDCQTQNALQSSLQVQDLFLELRTLRNQLHHLEDYLFGLAKDESLKSRELPPGPFPDEAPQWKSLNEYRNHLVEILRNKKKKIRQARELQKFLRRRLRSGTAVSTEMESLHKELAIARGFLPKTPVPKVTPIPSVLDEVSSETAKITQVKPKTLLKPKEPVLKRTESSEPKLETKSTLKIKEQSLNRVKDDKTKLDSSKPISKEPKDMKEPTLTKIKESLKPIEPTLTKIKESLKPIEPKKPIKIKLGGSKNKENKPDRIPLTKKRRTDEL